MNKYIKVSGENLSETHYNLGSKEDLYDLAEVFKEGDVGEIFEVEVIKLSKEKIDELQNDN